MEALILRMRHHLCRQVPTVPFARPGACASAMYRRENKVRGTGKSERVRGPGRCGGGTVNDNGIGTETAGGKQDGNGNGNENGEGGKRARESAVS